jgi:tetratricopeptide (TPR) repeat protein
MVINLEEAISYFKKRDFSKAIEVCKKLLINNNENFETLFLLSTIYIELNNIELANSFIKRAIRLNSNHPAVFNNLGIINKRLNNLEEAKINYLKAIKLKPDFAEAYNNYGLLCLDLKKYKESTKYFKEALRYKKNYNECYTNLGLALHELKNYKEAILNYNNAIKIKSDCAISHWNLGLAQLKLGNFEDGWTEYEWGKRCNFRTNKYQDKSSWSGQDLSEKTILLYCEQGLGDAIQFSRYIEYISKIAKKIIFQVPSSLKELLKNIRTNNKINIITNDDEPETFDYTCSIMSLPSILKTNTENIPLNIPYIIIENDLNQKWKEKLTNKNFKIGICSQAEKKNLRGHERSFDINILKKISELKNVELISLEKKDKEKIDSNKKITVTEFENLDNNNAFLDTAAIINNIDLIITCDTSVAHLSGALGKNTLLILKYNSDWRWLENKTTSPWYPTFKIFQENEFNSLNKVFDEVLNFLLKEYKLKQN